MKNLVITLTIAAFCIACNSGNIQMKSDLELSNLHGKVWKVDKRLNDTKMTCNCPAAQDDNCKQSLTVYNDKGRIAEFFEIDPDGDTATHSVYNYNSRGLCTGIDRISGKKFMKKEIPVYKKGKMVKLNMLDGNGELENTYEYAYSGNDVSAIHLYNEKGLLVNKTVNEYAQGNLASQTVTDKDGKVRSIVRYKRNEKNDIIESLYTIPGDTTEHKITFDYEYDDAGNWIRKTKYYRNEISNVVLRNIVYYGE